MPARPAVSPSRKALDLYAQSLADFANLGVTHETAVRSAFQTLLDDCARQVGWKLVPEYPLRRRGSRQPLRADGALVDGFSLPRGLWEAKDAGDDLDKEIKKKLALGYPPTNLLFQAPGRAVLYQNGQRVLDTPLAGPGQLTDTLRAFLGYEEPAIVEWEKAQVEFKDRIAEHGEALKTIIQRERKRSARFRDSFLAFFELCRGSLNPELSEAAVEEMLIQHILTERIFKRIFDVGDFMRRNVIAREIETVVEALTASAFSREEFLHSLDKFYVALEAAAGTITDFSEKQKFLNTVYERFFQGFSVAVADTHGIVYTPQPIVDFMVRSVDHLLKTEFGQSLASPGVHLLDPFTGTGNFVVNAMQHIPATDLPAKYATELHANEVMLLPYYVASMNIEHAYFDAVGKYEPFEGICLVDTFQTAEKDQGEFAMFNEANSERVERQRKAPIRVIIGNPPYNAWQQDENDNNKNRKYPTLDKRVSVTYGADSRATLRNSLGDPYIKAIRWAADRIGEEGIVAFVTNSGFVDGIAADGVRKHLAQDFDLIYVLDLGGNVRKNPKLSGTTHNVFGIQVGVSVNFFVRRPRKEKTGLRRAQIRYHATPTDARRGAKYEFLNEAGHVGGVNWEELTPDKRYNWLTDGREEGFADFLPIGTKEAKQSDGSAAVFRTYCNGIKSNSDAYVYDFDRETLIERANRMVDNYETELLRWQKKGRPKDLEGFLKVDATILKWVRHTKKTLLRGKEVPFDVNRVRIGLYRPFCKQNYYFEPAFNEDLYQFPEFLPHEASEQVNRVICVTQTQEKPFAAVATNHIPNLVVAGGFGAQTQCFPFYTYNEDGTARRENIPDAAQVAFWKHYGDESITKWDVFHYVYALLHHPGYRERFAGNLRRELPRIPFAPDFRAFADAGRQLAELHVGYETQPEFPLKRVENRAVARNLRVEKMRFTAPDRAAIRYNEFLTLEGIPPEAHAYRLGNRSALEWVLDQFAVSHDKASGLTSDPNQPDDETAILRLLGQVITVSVETVSLVDGLPRDFGAGETPGSEAYRQWRLQPSSLTSAEASEQREEMRLMTREHLSKTSPPNGTPSSAGPKRKTASSAKPTT